MKLFNKQISTGRLLLIASVIVNVLLAVAVYKAEKNTHFIRMALDRRGIINIEPQAYPDYYARDGWTNTVDKLNIEFDVAFFGNSITKGSNFQSFFPDRKVINLGYSGDVILGMLKRVPMLQAARPKKIFVMGGINDLFGGASVDEFAEKYDKLIKTIKDSIPQATVYLQSILPINPDIKDNSPDIAIIQQSNVHIHEIATKYGCQYIDVYSVYAKDGKLPPEVTKDGVHLIPQHYDRWAKLLEEYLN